MKGGRPIAGLLLAAGWCGAQDRCVLNPPKTAYIDALAEGRSKPVAEELRCGIRSLDLVKEELTRGRFRLVLNAALEAVSPGDDMLAASCHAGIVEGADSDESVGCYLGAARGRSQVLTTTGVAEAADALLKHSRPELARTLLIAGMQAVGAEPVTGGLVDRFLQASAAEPVRQEVFQAEGALPSGPANSWLERASKEIREVLTGEPCAFRLATSLEELQTALPALSGHAAVRHEHLNAFLAASADEYLRKGLPEDAFRRYMAAWVLMPDLPTAISMAGVLGQVTDVRSRAAGLKHLRASYVDGPSIIELGKRFVRHALFSTPDEPPTAGTVDLIRLYALMAVAETNGKRIEELALKALAAADSLTIEKPELYQALATIYRRLKLQEAADRADRTAARLKSAEALPFTAPPSGRFPGILTFKESSGMRLDVRTWKSTEGQTSFEFETQTQERTKPRMRTYGSSKEASFREVAANRIEGAPPAKAGDTLSIRTEVVVAPPVKDGDTLFIRYGRKWLEMTSHPAVEWLFKRPEAGAPRLSAQIYAPVDRLRIEVDRTKSKCRGAEEPEREATEVWVDPIVSYFRARLESNLGRGDEVRITSATPENRGAVLDEFTVQPQKTDLAGVHFFARVTVGVGGEDSGESRFGYTFAATADFPLFWRRKPDGCTGPVQLNATTSLVQFAPAGTRSVQTVGETGVYVPVKLLDYGTAAPHQRLFAAPIMVAGVTGATNWLSYGMRIGQMRIHDRSSGGSPELRAWLDFRYGSWVRYGPVTTRHGRFQMDGLYTIFKPLGDPGVGVVAGFSFSTGGGYSDYQVSVGYRAEMRQLLRNLR